MNPISFGVSTTLQADFELLRETPTLLGEPKYTQKTIDKLAQYIVCRNYGKLCLELCYLCWPIVKYGQKGQALLDFFWLRESTSPKAFRASIEALLDDHFSFLNEKERLNTSPKIKLNELGLIITSQQQSFTVSATRVAVLSAFLEWLTSHFSGFLDELENNLNLESAAQVKKVASLLQQRIYGVLKEHLPSANVQQKFRYINDWASSCLPDRHIGDEQVLQFWQAAFQQEGYVKYQSAVLDIIDYSFACDLCEHKLSVEAANSIDDILFEYQSGELPNQVALSVYEAYSEYVDDMSTISVLTQNPKLISKQQYQTVALLLEQQESIKRLPLSLLRTSVFSPWQAQIIQRSRSKEEKSSKRSQVNLAQPAMDYSEYSLGLDKWIKSACAAMLSCVGVLYEKKDPRCLAGLQVTLSHLLNKQEYASFVSALRSVVPEGDLFSDVSAALLQLPQLQKYVNLAMKQLNANNREGFRKSSEYLECDIYSDAIERLHNCISTIQKFQKATASVRDQGNFCSDLFIFSSEFEKRHGGING